MNQINVSENKTLKLQNVLSYRLDLETEDANMFDTEVNKMNTFIQTHGAKQIGPLIQHTFLKVNENNEVDVNIQFMLQSDNFIHNVETPYHMESVLRVKNCLYARYMGPESKIKIAYDKLGVYAFENEIELEDSNYTIYVSRNEEDETVVADVFIPVKEN
jgi:effector-binding domain-containing protein